MREYARQQTAFLLQGLAAEIKRAAREESADAIHDLRVAIRRLSRCLRSFSQFYPGRGWKKARAQLSELLHAAGAVRDRDIALELLAEAGSSGSAPIVIKLQAERAKARRELALEIRRWHERDFTGKWQSQLEL
jgi:CHAD domain-containing protein